MWYDFTLKDVSLVVLIPERNVFVHVLVHVFAVVKFMIYIDQSVKQW